MRPTVAALLPVSWAPNSVLKLPPYPRPSPEKTPASPLPPVLFLALLDNALDKPRPTQDGIIPRRASHLCSPLTCERCVILQMLGAQIAEVLRARE